jgi:phosphate:Na+ symporter
MNDSLQIGAILMGLAGGLAIFLYGMELMTGALKASSGRRLKNLLARMTTNRFKGVAAGAITTAIIQSSSVTTVLVVGFVSAGLMKLEQTIPIIMGASIGTTVTAQIIAFKITHYALLIIAAGFAMQFLSHNEVIRRTGTMVFGFGMIFFGMSLMGDATAPLRNYPPFIELLREMDHPLYGILLSALFTAVVQSSSATTGVIIMLASQGLISLEQGIALVFGANIGTCVTALLAAIGNSRDALRTALVHITFNTVGVMVWYFFIPQFADFIRHISPSHPELAGIRRLASETPRQIANAHTLFNVGNTLLFVGFTHQFARLVTWMVPVTEEEKKGGVRPRYLDPNLIDTPALALDRVRMEIGRMAERVLPMVRKGTEAAIAGSAADLSELTRMDNEVDQLHGPIVEYLRELSRQNLTSQEADLIHHYLAIASYYENIGDTLKLNLVHIGQKRLRGEVIISEATRHLFEELVDELIPLLERATHAVTRWDRKAAREVIRAKNRINERALQIERHITRRMAADAPQRRLTYQIESELLENLKRVYYFTKRIGKVVLEHNLKPGKESEAA